MQLIKINIFISSADTTVDMFDPLVVLFHTGMVVYIPKVHLRSKCLLDLKKFPFDTQICNVQFGSWTYDVTDLNVTHFTSADNSLDMRNHGRNREWTIVNTNIKRLEHKNNFGDEVYPYMQYSFTMKRNSSYYTYVFILPVTLLALIVPFSFLLPPDSKERITLGTNSATVYWKFKGILILWRGGDCALLLTLDHNNHNFHLGTNLRATLTLTIRYTSDQNSTPL